MSWGTSGKVDPLGDIRRESPRELQLVDVLFVDLIKRREAAAIRRTAVILPTLFALSLRIGNGYLGQLPRTFDHAVLGKRFRKSPRSKYR